MILRNNGPTHPEECHVKSELRACVLGGGGVLANMRLNPRLEMCLNMTLLV